MYKKYTINDNVAIQVLNYNDQMLVAKLWFTGKGSSSTHHHKNEEFNIVLSGEIETTRGHEKIQISSGQFIKIDSNVEHGIRNKTPNVEMISVWTPARKDIIEKFTGLEAQ